MQKGADVRECGTCRVGRAPREKGVVDDFRGGQGAQRDGPLCVAGWGATLFASL